MQGTCPEGSIEGLKPSAVLEDAGTYRERATGVMIEGLKSPMIQEDAGTCRASATG